MQIYIFDSNVKVGFSENRVTVKGKDGDGKSYPIENVEGVSLFGLPHISVAFMREMLTRGIELYFYSNDGHYFGRMNNPSLVSTKKQRKQALVGMSDSFRLAISKKIIHAKILNQLSLLKAHDTGGILSGDYYSTIEKSIVNVGFADSIDALMGYEGTAARMYFAALSRLVPEEFRFSGRSTRPPKDAFNSLISLGYSLIYKNIIGAVERYGLNPYFGFLHADAEGHMALVSDLMEEWRAVLVDDTVLCMLNDGEFAADMFTSTEKGGIYIGYGGAKKLIKAIVEKVGRARQYLSYDDYRYGFQHALDLQLQRLWRAIESEDASYYVPVSERPEESCEEDEFGFADVKVESEGALAAGAPDEKDIELSPATNEGESVIAAEASDERLV